MDGDEPQPLGIRHLTVVPVNFVPATGEQADDPVEI